MASICSSNHRLSTSKRRPKPSILRDYLLDDLSSCSSNGFKNFPRRQSSTVHRLLSAEIKRSDMLHHMNRRLTCGLPLSHAVHKASTAFRNAVKLLPFPSSSVTNASPSPSSSNENKKKGIFSRTFWKKPSRRRVDVDDGEIKREEEIQRRRSLPYSFSGGASSSNAAAESSSFSSDSEMTQTRSLSGESNGDDVVEQVTETLNGAVTRSGECVGSRVNDNSEECENEEKEQFSPISILECPFEDDSITPPSHQMGNNVKKLMRNRRFKSLARFEPVDLEKRIETYDSHLLDAEENLSANRLSALVKSRLIEEPNYLLASHNIDNVMLEFFKEEVSNIVTRDEDKLVKIVEEWVMRRQEQKDMFMSWEVREKREIYVKEMKWGCIIGDGRGYVVEELGNSIVTSLIDELILDMSL